MALALCVPASAATIPQFNRTTNDGVYDLSAAQASALGYAGAEYIGFFRVREGNGTTFNAGDTFDASTMFASVTSGAGSILAFLNGRNPDLSYTGAAFDDLGTTTVGALNSYTEGVAFLFSGTGNIVFRGSSTFNAGQSRGAITGIDVAPIPLPAGLVLLLSGLVGLGLFARKQRPVATA